MCRDNTDLCNKVSTHLYGRAFGTWNKLDLLDIITRLIHMPKACPYKLENVTPVCKNQIHSNFDLTRINES